MEKKIKSNNKAPHRKIVSAYTTKEYKAENELYRVFMYDTGINETEIESFTSQGITVTLAPYNKIAEEIIFARPDGVIFPDGELSPEHFNIVLGEAKKLTITNIALMGYGLGHSILSQAFCNEIINQKHVYSVEATGDIIASVNEFIRIMN